MVSWLKLKNSFPSDLSSSACSSALVVSRHISLICCAICICVCFTARDRFISRFVFKVQTTRSKPQIDKRYLEYTECTLSIVTRPKDYTITHKEIRAALTGVHTGRAAGAS
jgi:hypothetical protein